MGHVDTVTRAHSELQEYPAESAVGPKRAWPGKHALVRVETCYRILDILSWIAAITGSLGFAMVYRLAPSWLTHSYWFWLFPAFQLPMFASAIARGLPFQVRFGVLAADLLIATLANGVLFAIWPSWFMVALLLVIPSTLFYGTRAGVGALLVVMLLNALIGWGWVTGALPPQSIGVQLSSVIMDNRVAAVWIRVLSVGGAGCAAIVMMLRYVLGDLNRALHDSNRALQRLATEQEFRIRAEEARFAAEQIAKEAQKFEALGRMASGVAHDFNNTLCVMKLWTGLLADDPDADLPTMRAALIDIKEATASAQQLTSHLLAFSRDEAGERGSCDLADVVRRDSETLSRILPENIVVESRLEADAFVPLSAGQVQEILLNLGANARDAMPNGGRLLIQTATESRESATDALPPGRYGLLSVTDTGFGMTEDIKARVFEPFFTTKAPGAGTGLGLAMVYGLVTGAGGSISVESRPGQGTTFTIALPIVEKPGSIAEPRRGSVGGVNRCPVLVVDKQSEMGTLVERILVKDGFPTDWARNSAAALEKIAASTVAVGLLILEGVMPEVPTLEIISAAYRRNPACKIIVISGHMMDTAIITGIEEGMYHKLSKPFDADTLRRVVSEALAA
jgi:signal transduction histidine kinase